MLFRSGQGVADISSPSEPIASTVARSGTADIIEESMQGDDGERNRQGDNDGGLTEWNGNRVVRIVSSLGEDRFDPYILERIIGKAIRGTERGR